MVEGFAKYSARNFVKTLDKFPSKRVGTVNIRHLSYGKSTLWPAKIQKVKSYNINLNFLIGKIFNKVYNLTSTLKNFQGHPELPEKMSCFGSW